MYQGYNCHYMPGWIDGTVGYHADDGKIFEARCGDNLGREVAGNLMIRLTVNSFPTFTMRFNFEFILAAKFLMSSFIFRGFARFDFLSSFLRAD